ncbi:unnamed protein product [Candidula unifasciata]|uniref:Uncharacterized protein n=1 Tax=Candidula unifasciata TaxID=100452 RepID=A0A8S3YM24_9EUPU|nr:unnamed protein product [Candidula unifasciata]
MEVVEQGGRVATESVAGWYRPKSNSQTGITSVCSFTPKDSGQRTHAMLNLARDLLQNVKHRTHSMQPARGSWPRNEDSSSASVLPRKSDHTVVNTDVTPQSEKNTDTAILAEVTNGSRVYAETTQPLLKSGSFLQHARKSLVTFMRRVRKYWTQDDVNEPVSEDQRRAVKSVELAKPEITKINPEEDNQEMTDKSDFPCNTLDCELQTEARKSDLQYISGGLQSRVKEHYKDMVVLGVTSNADSRRDKTKYHRQFTCSTFHYREDDASGINKCIIGILSRQVDCPGNC